MTSSWPMKVMASSNLTMISMSNTNMVWSTSFVAAEREEPGRAYSVQFADNDTVRLFRFGGETIAEAHLDKAINDGPVPPCQG